MTRLGIKVLTVTFLICMIIATSYSSIVGAQPIGREARTMHRIKTTNVNPNALGPEAPYFTPVDIKTAYNLPTGGGSGTIAIIDAYDAPRIATDLATFSSQWGLPAANLEVHKMSSFIWPNSGWALETSLDVEWAHAIAPNAKILLVEARSASITDLLSAVNYARNRADVVAISMSWGANEFSGQTSYDSYFTSTYGASFFASSGDAGGVVSWPSSSVNVISVGGTTLTQTSTGYTETAWSGSGGGVSSQEPKPNYQISLSYSKRSTPDVAYNADPATGFLVLDSYGYGGSSGWFAVGGTSAGAPQWAAIHALGLSATNANFYAGYPQSYGEDFADITQGTSGGYTAGLNYDLATGIGSPIGTDYGAPVAPDFSVSASPSSLTVNAGSQGSTAITVTSIGGFSDPVTLTTTTPSGWTQPSPITVTPTATTQLAITVPSTANAGTYQVTVTGASGTAAKTITLTVQVTKADFSLTANPTSLSIRQGSSGTTRVTVKSINGYTDSASLSATGQPSGMTCTFSPAAVKAGSSATMTIAVARTTAQGTFTITITGTDAATGLTHTATVRVTVRR
jgi:subtilase family serine protease